MSMYSLPTQVSLLPIDALQEAINNECINSVNKKPLSLDKLISAGLLTFTVPPNTTLVVGEKVQWGDTVTGFVNSDKHLVGLGLVVN